MSDAHILFSIENAIATITLNRPDKLNAITLAMLDQIETIVAGLEKDRDVRVVILTGTGEQAFSVGADIKEWERVMADDPIAMWRAWDRPGHRVFERLARVQQPTIAAINGYAFGGGLELALAADIRIAADHAEFALPETKIGTQPGWTGSQRLPALIGAALAKQIIFTGARVKADVAERWGLGQRSCAAPALDAARAKSQTRSRPTRRSQYSLPRRLWTRAQDRVSTSRSKGSLPRCPRQPAMAKRVPPRSAKNARRSSLDDNAVMTEDASAGANHGRFKQANAPSFVDTRISRCDHGLRPRWDHPRNERQGNPDIR